MPLQDTLDPYLKTAVDLDTVEAQNSDTQRRRNVCNVLSTSVSHRQNQNGNNHFIEWNVDSTFVSIDSADASFYDDWEFQ